MNTKMVIAMMLVASLSAGAWAVGFLGTPTAEIGQGQWSVGYDYGYSDQDFKSSTFKFTEWYRNDDGDFVDQGGDPADDPVAQRVRMSFKDFRIHRHYATIGYGVTDDWDVYVKLGIANVKGKVRTQGEASWDRINYGSDFSFGWGTRYTFLRDGNITWGAALQMNWVNVEGSSRFADEQVDEFGADTTYNSAGKLKYTYKSYDILFAAGPTVDMGGWNLYGGPFYYYVNTDLKWKESGAWTLFDDDAGAGIVDDGRYSFKGSASPKARSNFGGFIGANFDLMANTTATIELASTTRGGWGLGAGVAYKF